MHGGRKVLDPLVLGAGEVDGGRVGYEAEAEGAPPVGEDRVDGPLRSAPDAVEKHPDPGHRNRVAPREADDAAGGHGLRCGARDPGEQEDDTEAGTQKVTYAPRSRGAPARSRD